MKPGLADPVIGDSVGSSGDKSIEREVFGTDNPSTITAILDRFCRERLGSGIGQGLFAEKTIGAVYGFRLEDGRRVVLKGHQRWFRSLKQATACLQVQAALNAAGFPAPLPLVPPSSVPGGRSPDGGGVDRWRPRRRPRPDRPAHDGFHAGGSHSSRLIACQRGASRYLVGLAGRSALASTTQ